MNAMSRHIDAMSQYIVVLSRCRKIAPRRRCISPGPVEGVPVLILTALLFLAPACDNRSDTIDTDGPPSSHPSDQPVAWTGATVWTGTGETIPNAALIVEEGRVVDVFSLDDHSLPGHIRQTRDASGRYIVPGLINAHGHVGIARGLETGEAARTAENIHSQLTLYARYGVTSVVSLDEPLVAFDVRNNQNPLHPGKARLYLSGPVLSPSTPEEAVRDVNELLQHDPDWVKIRVDDQLGRRTKMSPDIYGAVIRASREYSTPVASHMVTLEDAKELLHRGTGLLAHSVRDRPVDDELISLMLERKVCITPTLTRELSVFVYARRPDFFDDPFFLKYADPDVLEELQKPEIQQRYTGRSADYYREALPVAIDNMMALHRAGIPVAMGTDSGPPARFQGYFEHLEMEMMQDAGMQPEEVLASATRIAARCMNIEYSGTLESGNLADFLLVDQDPLEDIRNLRSIQAVYIGGKPVER